MKSHKLVYLKWYSWNDVGNGASSYFEHLCWLSLGKISIMMGPNIDLLPMGSVRLGGEAAGIIVFAASSHFVDMVPKGGVACHILITITFTYLVG